jgi:hypothetical protein
MKKYHVTFFYLATGMEGIPDERDFGIIIAPTHFVAKLKVLEKYFSPDDYYLEPCKLSPQGFTSWEWIIVCLNAEEIK